MYGKPAWNKGKTMPEEMKEKVRQANLGKKLSEEHKRKISKTLKGRIPRNRGIKKIKIEDKNEK